MSALLRRVFLGQVTVVKPARARVVGLLALVAACPMLVVACGDDDDESADLPTTSVAAEVASTTEAVTTTEAATTTTEAVTATTEASSDLPTYAEYLAALPPGTETCESSGEVSEIGGDMYSVGGPDAQVSMRNGQLVIFCPGAMLVVGEPFTGVNQNGEPLVKGSLFSVDPDGTFVELSTF